MPTKKSPSKRKPAALPKQRIASRSSCRWLLLIDNVPIREAAVAEYQELEEKLRETREQIEAFEGGDLPAYQRWEASVFGPLLTELRTTMQAVDEKRRILEAIEDEVLWGRCSYVTAYRRVMRAIKSPPPPKESHGAWEESAGPEADFEEEPEGGQLFGDSDLPKDFDIDQFDRSSKQKQKKFRDYYETMASMYEMFTGFRAPDLDDLLHRERARKRGEEGARADIPPAMPRHAEPEIDHEASRLKELYRSLVRQLHPDTAQEQTARERELWHEVQEAYRARDLERMEAVAGRVEIGLKGSALHLPVQILRRMTKDLRAALRGLRSRVSDLRKHPAWSFRKKAKDLAKIEAKHRRLLTAELREYKSALKAYTADLEQLAAEAEAPRTRKKTKKKKARATPRDDEPF